MLAGVRDDGASVLDARVVLGGGVLSGVAGRDAAGVPRVARRRRSSGSAACSSEIRYDNLTSAVKQVLKGRRRVETDRFVALRSHYLFASQFTTAGHRGRAREGRRRGRGRPLPAQPSGPGPGGRDLAELNALLLAGCERDLRRRIVGRGRSRSVRRGPRSGRCCARCPAERVRRGETAAPRVDAKSLVTVRQNRYSVPVALAGLRVSARIGAREITISHDGAVVARHERLHGRFGTSAQLDHYLELLAAQAGRAGALAGAAQERERGGWPAASTSSGRR